MARLALLIFIAAVLTAAPSVELFKVGLPMNEPFGIAFDVSGNAYIVEHKGQRILRVTPQGETSVFAGTGEVGFSGDGGPATKAQFFDPHGIVITRTGVMYVADTRNHRVRSINLATGQTATIAGTGVEGFAGDGGPAPQAAFNGTFAIALSSDDRTLYVTDLGNRRVRRIDLTSGHVATVAGNGESAVPPEGASAVAAPLVDPRAAAPDTAGNLWVLERRGNALRVVNASGKISTMIAPSTVSPDLNGPKHLTTDARGRVIIADAENHLVRMWDPAARRLTTIAGTGAKGTRVVTGEPLQTELNRPHGVTVAPDGSLYIVDSYNNRILRVRDYAGPFTVSEADKARLREKLDVLRGALRPHGSHALIADAEVYAKAAEWILRHPEEFYRPEYLANTFDALERGLARAKELSTLRTSWASAKGKVIRGYRSRVDGSVQPYAITVPESYDGGKPVRLDVILHGRAAQMNEVSFLASKPNLPARTHLQLEVFGRTNNAYRWAGETDVWEALAAARKHYSIDPLRIVLRGFSMGGAGAWHIGLHHPSEFAAVEAGAGFTETKRYANLRDLPPWQEAALTIYDAALYAKNAHNVPVVGYGGELDKQLQASLNIKQQLEGELVRALFLIGPQTEHRWHPDSRKQSDAFLDEAVATRASDPDHVRFVTYTTRYNRAYWVTVDALDRHYERAEVDAHREGNRYVVKTTNVARLSLPAAAEVDIDGQKVTGAGALEKRNGKWSKAGRAEVRKTHGLQGPIDDAFLDTFLCVRPTGTPWNAAVNDHAKSSLDRFAREFAKWLRGDVRQVDDRGLLKREMAEHHLILFGDPGSNRVIARILDRLPIKWSRESLVAGGRTYKAADSVPVLIFPNPLNPKRYVVINSGHTFGTREFEGTNALLFPRLGDWAVLRAGSGDVLDAGIFDDRWGFASGK